MRIAVRLLPVVVAIAAVLAIGAAGGASRPVSDGAHCQSSGQGAPAGWATRIPAGWHVVGFSESSGSIRASGTQLSDVALPAPRLVAGYPIQVNGGVLPKRGIGLIIATDTDPTQAPSDVSALPLPSPSGDRWSVGSALAGAPYLETLWFRIACTRLIASAKIGPDVSRGALRQLAGVIESVREQPARGRQSPEDGLISGSLSVCCDAHGRTPEDGIVLIRASDGAGYAVQVGRSGDFAIPLAPGHYRIVGGIPRLGWPLGECIALPARSSGSPAEPTIVRAHTRTRVIVNCQGQ
jgi:hypothetical protein